MLIKAALQIPEELPRSPRVADNAGNTAFQMLDAARRQMDQRLQKVRVRSLTSGGKPKTLELNVTFPVVTGVE